MSIIPNKLFDSQQICRQLHFSRVETLHVFHLLESQEVTPASKGWFAHDKQWEKNISKGL